MENTQNKPGKTQSLISTSRKKLTEIGALWYKESKDNEDKNQDEGKEDYFTGEVTVNGVEQKIIVFRNNFKDIDKKPDWRIYLREPMVNRVAEVKTAAMSLKTSVKAIETEQDVEYPAGL